MFIQPCFIRKNTSLLINSLEKLGYSKNSPSWTDKCTIIWCYQYSNENGFDTPHYVIANAFDIPFDKHSKLCGKFIDCGTNEQLFLAIAALRDDNDYMQWFTNGINWYLCDAQRVENSALYDKEYKIQIKCGGDYHKASVEELIEHFRNN